MNFKFSNLLGAPYRGGNVEFKKDAVLLSPVGNRISVTDLQKSESITLPFENGRNISRIAVSPSGSLLLSIDETGRSLLVNLHTHVVLHHFSFKGPVTALKFSPDGTLFAAGVGKLLQIWRTPGFRKEFAPFQLISTLAGCHDSITCLGWSSDSRWIVAGSKDLSTKLFSVYRAPDQHAVTLSGHRDVLVGVFFAKPLVSAHDVGLYTLSRDGALFDWRYFPNADLLQADENKDHARAGRKRRMQTEKDDMDLDGQKQHKDGEQMQQEEEDMGAGRRQKTETNLITGHWRQSKKNFFMQSAKLASCDYHMGLGLLVAGFSSGVFGLYQLPDFTCIHMLSISTERITTSVFNSTGNLLAFGCANLGQLLVWEWRTETQILKQQGHFFDVNCVAFSPDSQYLASGADDNKLKLWSAASGSCYVTFADHPSAITAVLFLPTNHVVVSASLDGTVRAYDLVRYRNFRTFTTPTPVQFVSLAADQSGEVICAGTLDSFQIFVWSVKTGRLLDMLSGHEGPVHGLSFSPVHEILASSSWDKTVRLWDVFEGKGNVETLTHTHDVLTLAYHPDGKQLACSTLDGQIHLWNPIDAMLMGTIEGRRDIAGGRRMGDRRTAANTSSGKCFTCLSYSADGSFLIAGGSSKFICMYDVVDQVLLRRIQITHNRSLDGVLDFLNSKNMTSAGPLDLIDDDDSDEEDGTDRQSQKRLGFGLPGTGSNKARPVVRTKSLQLCPTGRSFAAATTEGLLLYSMDDNLVFDPADFDIDVTPEAVDEALQENQHARALILALRLNEFSLIRKCVEAVPPWEISDITRAIPPSHLGTLCTILAEFLDKSPHLEFLLQWCEELCVWHGKMLEAQQRELLPRLRSLLKRLVQRHEELAGMCSSNQYMLQFLCSGFSSNKVNGVVAMKL